MHRLFSQIFLDEKRAKEAGVVRTRRDVNDLMTGGDEKRRRGEEEIDVETSGETECEMKESEGGG